MRKSGIKRSGSSTQREWIQLDFQEEHLTIIQGEKEVWEDPVNVGWMNSTETGTGYWPKV